jgi:hypothetical protein
LLRLNPDLPCGKKSQTTQYAVCFGQSALCRVSLIGKTTSAGHGIPSTVRVVTRPSNEV